MTTQPLPRRIQDVPVLEYTPAPVPPRGRIVVLHGFTGRKEDSISICQAFAQAGYAVRAIDLYLHGQAGPTPFDAPATVRRLEEVVDRSCAFLDAVIADDPLPTGLLGISLGGVVIYRYLMTRPLDGPVRAAVALIAGLPHVWPETLRRAGPLFPAFGVDEAMIAAAQANLRDNPPPPLLQGVRDFPLLMQYGGSDPIVPIAAVRAAFAAAQARYTRKELIQFIEYPAAGHQTPPEMYTRAGEWFDRYLGDPLA